MAASCSENWMLCGLSTISLGVASSPASSESVITPCSCRSSNARPSLVGSLGMEMVAPSAIAARSVERPANTPIGSKWILPALTRSVPFSAL